MPRRILSWELLNSVRPHTADQRMLYRQAENLFYRRMVFLREIAPTKASLQIIQNRSAIAHITVETNTEGKILVTEGDIVETVPDVTRINCVAALISLREYLRANPIKTWETQINRALNNSTETATSRVTATSHLLFSLQKRYTQWSLQALGVPLKIFGDLAESDLRDTDKLLPALKTHGKSAGVRTISDNRFPLATPMEKNLARLLAQSSSYSYYGMTNETLGNLIPLLDGALLFLGKGDDPFDRPLTFVKDTITPEIFIDSDGAGMLTLTPRLRLGDQDIPTDKSIDLVLEQPPYIVVGSQLIGLSSLPPVVATLMDQQDPLLIPEEEQALFIQEYLPRLAEQVEITGQLGIQETITGLAPVPHLYLKEIENRLVAVLKFGYAEVEVAASKTPPRISVLPHPSKSGLVRLERDVVKEEMLYEAVNTQGLRRGVEPGAFEMRATVDILKFLTKYLPALALQGFVIFGEESLKLARINRSTPTMSLKVKSGIDWFDVEAFVQFGDVTASLKDVKSAIRKREKYVKLADGSLGLLPEDWIGRFRHLFALGEDSVIEGRESLRLSPLHALLLEQAIKDTDGDSVADAAFEERKNRLRSFDQITPIDLPSGLKLPLRPYQKSGVDWLHFLHEHQFGGCLADDMGLGKTSQCLTFLLSLKENKQTKKASILIVPRSLIINWERECEKFTPDLKILRYDGLDRTNTSKEFDKYDIVLSTYGVLLRDIAKLKDYPFYYAILDEAQAVKNPLSQTSRAVRLLNANHRLTLTGTPVENGTMELWSQFAFLNPGHLGNMESFRTEFANVPDSHTALRQLIHPFLLRRTKEQVAPELPPRTEEIRLIEMEPAQRSLYEKTRDKYRAQILGIMGDDGNPESRTGMASAQMSILEGLLRLRQICNHPQLLDATSKVESAKMESLLETLESLRAEGHKALIFSQFTTMLGLIRTELDARKIPYQYLDGRTRDRQARVDAFQADTTCPFFLISLKAGGVGLNLTAADYVLHIDPWWNPAVEQQATDRTHRIGQDKPVFVYKFITKDTVEEKIQLLQEKKRQLVSELISNESGVLKSLTRADIDALFR
jgi:non-specific serine/threonine protein kinase